MPPRGEGRGRLFDVPIALQMRKVAATIPGGFEPNYVDVPWLFSIAITQLLNVRKIK